MRFGVRVLRVLNTVFGRVRDRLTLEFDIFGTLWLDVSLSFVFQQFEHCPCLARCYRTEAHPRNRVRGEQIRVLTQFKIQLIGRNVRPGKVALVLEAEKEGLTDRVVLVSDGEQAGVDAVVTVTFRFVPHERSVGIPTERTLLSVDEEGAMFL